MKKNFIILKFVFEIAFNLFLLKNVNNNNYKKSIITIIKGIMNKKHNMKQNNAAYVISILS